VPNGLNGLAPQDGELGEDVAVDDATQFAAAAQGVRPVRECGPDDVIGAGAVVVELVHAVEADGAEDHSRVLLGRCVEAITGGVWGQGVADDGLRELAVRCEHQEPVWLPTECELAAHQGAV